MMEWRTDQMNSSVFAPCVATVGFFDGVHKGHQYLMKQVRNVASRLGLPSMVITFANHPRKVTDAGYCPRLLTTFDEKSRLLAATGVDYGCVLTFTPAMASLTAEAFMHEYLQERFHVKALVMGYDHRFGSDRKGVEACRGYGEQYGIQVYAADEYRNGSQCHVSSSTARQAVMAGDMKEAYRLLGHPYGLEAVVVDGQHLGRTIGFPTANLELTGTDKLLPCDGVYAVWMWIDGQRYAGMANLGQRPTVNDSEKKTLEIHLLDFHQNIYGQKVQVEFMEYVRAEQKFEGLDALARALEQDREQVRQILFEEKQV